ncbi:MAG: TadE family protein [Nocardioides sp.]
MSTAHITPHTGANRNRAATPNGAATPNVAPPPRPTDSEQGAASVELLLMAPVFVAFILSVVGGGRLVEARGQVNDAAYAAARAASLAPGNPEQAAADAAHAALAERGRACTQLTVSLHGSDMVPGGQVRATVTCLADLSDVTGVGLPGSKRFAGSAVVPIEQFRRPR